MFKNTNKGRGGGEEEVLDKEINDSDEDNDKRSA
jgi:hypothetical protein